MTASCASSVNSCSGFGCRLGGAAEASGGLDIRDARGADVCGSNVASGSQRTDHGLVSDSLAVGRARSIPGGCGSTLGSLCLASGAFGLGSSAAARRLSPVAVVLLRSGLLVLDTRVSLVVTCTLSVLLSSTARLDGRGLPEAVRLCDVETFESCGDGLSCLLESDLSVLSPSRALADILGGRNGFSCAAAPFTPKDDSLAEEEDIVRPWPTASAAADLIRCRDGDAISGCLRNHVLGHTSLRSRSRPSVNLHRPRFWRGSASTPRSLNRA